MSGINIYLDIDGVLNRYGPVRKGRSGVDPADPEADEWPAYTSSGGVLVWPPRDDREDQPAHRRRRRHPPTG
ncbi:MAG: hypothetical protein SOH99_09235 [Acidipropionibacterium acidipropionici]|jgi:hypothetical protein|uniref:hypothetical protein n=1 Tax=Acidipropionibacterium acidipropionici TaxID=1748 RepID=UPI002F360690